MNYDRIAGSGRIVSGTLKDLWGKLTGNPITRTAGRRDQLMGKTQELYGRATEHPFVLLGLAAAVGIIVATLLSMRDTRTARHHWRR